METTDADEIIVPLCIIIICAGLHQLRGQMARRRYWVRPWINRRDTYGAYHALLKELSDEDGFFAFVSAMLLQNNVYKH